MQRAIRLSICFLFALSLAIAVYFMLTSPLAFKKVVTIERVEGRRELSSAPEEWLQVDEFIRAIPYQTDPSPTLLVHPKQQYIRTVQEGFGNCSNLTFGSAYYLAAQGYPFQIVHLIEPSNFLQGWGHTVLHVPVSFRGREFAGIVDLWEGGLVTANGEFVDLASLRKGELARPGVLSLNSRRDSTSAFNSRADQFYGDFLDRAAVGVTNPDEVKAYFELLEAAHIPGADGKIKKMIYDSLAIVLGAYPSIEVDADDYERLFEGHGLVRFLGVTLLLSVRLLVVMLVLYLGVSLASRIRRSRSGRSEGAA